MTPGVEDQSLLHVLIARADDHGAVFEPKRVLVIGDAPVQVEAVKAFLAQAGQQVGGPVDAQTARFHPEVDLHVVHQGWIGYLVLTRQLQRVLDGDGGGVTRFAAIDAVVQRQDCQLQIGDALPFDEGWQLGHRGRARTGLQQTGQQWQ